MYSDHPFGPNVAVSPANFDIASFARRPHLNVAMISMPRFLVNVWLHAWPRPGLGRAYI